MLSENPFSENNEIPRVYKFKSGGGMMPTPNQQLLDKVNKSGKWFRARKTKCLWAKEITSEQTVRTIEGEVSALAGDYLCRGESGEVWPQTAKTLFAKYEAAGETDKDGWEKYCPIPQAAGVLAAKIDHPFQVTATWGELAGQPGDYLVKSESEISTEYPEDVWVVAQAVFARTYEAGES
jgi:hypothetical protein